MTTALPNREILKWREGWPEEANERLEDFDYTEVPEEAGAHVVILDNNTVMISKSAKKTI